MPTMKRIAVSTDTWRKRVHDFTAEACGCKTAGPPVHASTHTHMGLPPTGVFVARDLGRLHRGGPASQSSQHLGVPTPMTARVAVLSGVAEGDGTHASEAPPVWRFYDAASGAAPGDGPHRARPAGPRRNPTGGPRRTPKDHSVTPGLLPKSPFAGSLSGGLPTHTESLRHPARPDMGLAARIRSLHTSFEPTPDNRNNYCAIGDQSMVVKWQQQCAHRISIASWFGMPPNMLFPLTQDRIDGGGTWKTWHTISALGQTGEYTSSVSAYCTACVGETSWKLEVRRNGQDTWTRVFDMIIPQGFWAGFSVTFYDPFPPLQYLVDSLIPIPLNLLVGGDTYRFAPYDVRVSGEGGQHRYFVEFRRAFEQYDTFQDLRTPEQLRLDGLLPAYLEPLRPAEVPPDD